MKRSGRLRWALSLIPVLLLAGFLGFAVLAGTAAGAAQALFYLCAFILVVSLLVGLIRGDDPGHYQ